MMNALADAEQRLQDARSIVITTHVNPDADGLGSGLALLLALRDLDKEVTFLCPGTPPGLYAFLPGFAAIQSCSSAEAAHAEALADVLLSCDAGSIDRLEHVAEVARGSLINCDHHASNTRFGDINVVDESAACTGMVIERLIDGLGVAIDADMAANLYAAVVFDTGRFMHANTSASVLRWAARLLETGIDAAAINRQLTYIKTPHDLAVIRLGLEHLHVDKEQPALAGIVLSRSLIEGVGEPEDWGELIEFPRSLAGNQVAYLLREQPDRQSVRASLRANPPYEVEPIASAFGGGGHRQAAGCTIPGNLAQALGQILPLLRQALDGPGEPEGGRTA